MPVYLFTLAALTSESANVSDFSPHITFAVSWHRIWDLTVGIIHKIFDFMTCVVIRSLCLLQQKVKPIRIPIKCVIQITESFKIAYDFLLDFYFILSLI